MLTAVAMGVAIAHGFFWAVIHPVNVEMKRWSLEAIPENWRMARERWEHGHTARAFLVIGALAALTLALLEESADSSAG